VRNNAENLAYQTEKLLTDNEDKLPEEVKTEMQGDVDAVKEALKGEDDDAVKTAYDKLVANQQKIGEAIYNQQGAEGAAAGDEPGADSSAGAEDDVVDAEVVDEEDEEEKYGLPRATTSRPRSQASLSATSAGSIRTPVRSVPRPTPSRPRTGPKKSRSWIRVPVRPEPSPPMPATSGWTSPPMLRVSRTPSRPKSPNRARRPRLTSRISSASMPNTRH